MNAPANASPREAWRLVADTHARLLEAIRRQPGVATAGHANFLPLAVAAGFALLAALGLPAGPGLAAAGILLAAMPAMGVYPILAAQYGEGPPAAVAMLAMTLLSFFTLGALLWILGTAG